MSLELWSPWCLGCALTHCTTDAQIHESNLNIRCKLCDIRVIDHFENRTSMSKMQCGQNNFWMWRTGTGQSFDISMTLVYFDVFISRCFLLRCIRSIWDAVKREKKSCIDRCIVRWNWKIEWRRKKHGERMNTYMLISLIAREKKMVWMRTSVCIFCNIFRWQMVTIHVEKE